MRIGIDASRAFTEQPTGTERYSYEVMTRMLKLPEAREHDWILYVRPNLKFEIRNLKLSSNFKFKIVNLTYLWTQVGLAYRTWVDKLDALWVPAHTLPVLRKPGLKTIVTIHGIEYEWLPAYENPLQKWYLPWSTRYAVSAASKIISVSEFTKKELIRRWGADPNKIHVIHEGYSPKIQITNDKSQILNKYKIQPKKYLLFVGTVQPRKNLERLIQAFTNVVTPPNPPLNLRGGNLEGELKLVIAGKLGWGYESVEQMAKSMEEKVILTGYISDGDRQILLENALAYVQPSITEGFGLPILEAMAAGIPVVSSNGGALKEVVGEAGVLFDPYDVEDMAKWLKAVAEDNGLRQKLIKSGKERVKDFSWDRAAKETLDLIIHNNKLIV
jgi:glycosyltransferase involved in cell wall biosynthesis